MPAPSWESLDDFLQPDTAGGFASTATITLQVTDETRTVVGIFDDPYLNADLGEYEADTSAPRFTCKEADVAGVDRGDTLTLDGRVYDIMTAPQSDGAGMACIRMEPR